MSFSAYPVTFDSRYPWLEQSKLVSLEILTFAKLAQQDGVGVVGVMLLVSLAHD
jgi:hypothetical protein